MNVRAIESIILVIRTIFVMRVRLISVVIILIIIVLGAFLFF